MKTKLLSVAFLFLVLFSMQAQDKAPRFIVGAGLPFPHAEDKRAPHADPDAPVSASITFSPCLNLYFQNDYPVGNTFRFGGRLNYTMISAQQEVDLSKYNRYNMFSLLGTAVWQPQKYLYVTLGAGPNFIRGAGEGVNMHGLFAANTFFKKVIFSVGYEFYVPTVKEKVDVPKDNYDFGHFTIGLGYQF